MRWTAIIGLALGLFHSAAATALAVHQAASPEKQKPVFQWIFALVMVGLVCAVAFKNPKRSHQG